MELALNIEELIDALPTESCEVLASVLDSIAEFPLLLITEAEEDAVTGVARSEVVEDLGLEDVILTLEGPNDELR